MSFDLGVLALDGWTDVSEVAAMADRCQSLNHVEGELDERIVGFYERLRARFPDHSPGWDADDCPWASMPLDVGIDHVFMHLRFGESSHPAIALIADLTTEFGLTLWDPQDESAHPPVTPPARREVEAWWRELLDGRCSREEIYDRVRMWVEDPPEPVDDPITLMGLQHLHGLGLTGQDDASFEEWLAHGTQFDADPDGWQRNRYRQAVEAVRRDQGSDKARALAKRLVAAGWLPESWEE